ncbi:DUF1059 domain-containing protein [Actinomadura madurae]|uniref:DUF1059 domain-containing protein n=1 Tax=Actinomadura madurae TaxID=1993 RepID=UPI0020276801|nr:DUF1059 domain-containing protein [Actinomadura madurae]URM99435.1 DUF1059 domain-containing protein [Actinomadura madurae]
MRREQGWTSGAAVHLSRGRVQAGEGGTMRKTADCRDMPSESGCTLTISGEEDEVVRAAAEHAVSVHGHADTPELRDEIRAHLKDEQAMAQG